MSRHLGSFLRGSKDWIQYSMLNVSGHRPVEWWWMTVNEVERCWAKFHCHETSDPKSLELFIYLLIYLFKKMQFVKTFQQKNKIKMKSVRRFDVSIIIRKLKLKIQEIENKRIRKSQNDQHFLSLIYNQFHDNVSSVLDNDVVDTSTRHIFLIHRHPSSIKTVINAFNMFNSTTLSGVSSRCRSRVRVPPLFQQCAKELYIECLPLTKKGNFGWTVNSKAILALPDRRISKINGQSWEVVQNLQNSQPESVQTKNCVSFTFFYHAVPGPAPKIKLVPDTL